MTIRISKTVLHLKLAVHNLRLGLRRMLLTNQPVQVVRVECGESEEVSVGAKRAESGV